jgi:hypothetical protein
MRIALVIVGVVIAAFLVGCATYRTGPQSRPELNWSDNERYHLGIIELDDQGWLRSRDDATKVLDHIERIVESGPTNIVVFVHGWHHSASPEDCNLAAFKRVLARVDEEMQIPLYREARRAVFGNPEAKVVGLYIGWRGRSLPGFLDYATFWDRKPAALRVGHGDLPEVLTRVHSIYAKGNDPSQVKNSYAGLVTIGHSFGGQVVFAAISDLLKSRVAEAIPLTASRPSPTPHVAGFGDLVVLVNPALEASVYNSIDTLTRGAKFDSMQTPVMMIISSERDWPNRRLFPIGRFFSVLHEPIGATKQLSQKVKAMGWYKPHITHCLALDGGPGCDGAAARVINIDMTKEVRPPATASSDESHCPEAAAITLDVSISKRLAGAWTADFLVQPKRIHLAGDLAVAGTRFFRVDPALDPNNPFVVVKATGDVSGDHNDMFNPNLVSFLVRYAAGAQLKRLAPRVLAEKAGH